MTTKEITGRHVLIGTVAAFGVIVAVNVTMAVKAVGTFPGLEVRNSYVASQSFEARRDAQDALGWRVQTDYDGARIRLAITDAEGGTVAPASIDAVIGRPTVARDDVALIFSRDGGALTAPVELGTGRWVLKLTAESADGAPFAKRIALRVR